MQPVNNSFVISRVVGDISPVDPQASTLTKIKNLVGDVWESCRYALAYLARFVGYQPEILFKAQMREDLRVVVQSFSKKTSQEDEGLKKIVRAFESAVSKVDSTLSKKDVSALFIETLRTLSVARRNPLPSLDKKNFELLTEQVQSQLGIEAEIAQPETVTKEKKKLSWEVSSSLMRKVAWVAAGCAAIALSYYLYKLDPSKQNVDLAFIDTSGVKHPLNEIETSSSTEVDFFGLNKGLSVTTGALTAFLLNRRQAVKESTQNCKITNQNQELWDRCQSPSWRSAHEDHCKTVSEEWLPGALRTQGTCRLNQGFLSMFKWGESEHLPSSQESSSSQISNPSMRDDLLEDQALRACENLKKAYSYPEQDVDQDQVFGQNSKQMAFTQALQTKGILKPTEDLAKIHEVIQASCPSQASVRAMQTRTQPLELPSSSEDNTSEI